MTPSDSSHHFWSIYMSGTSKSDQHYARYMHFMTLQNARGNGLFLSTLQKIMAIWTKFGLFIIFNDFNHKNSVLTRFYQQWHSYGDDFLKLVACPFSMVRTHAIFDPDKIWLSNMDNSDSPHIFASNESIIYDIGWQFRPQFSSPKPMKTMLCCCG